MLEGKHALSNVSWYFSGVVSSCIIRERRACTMDCRVNWGPGGGPLLLGDGAVSAGWAAARWEGTDCCCGCRCTDFCCCSACG